jgi:hypothetical protein
MAARLYHPKVLHAIDALARYYARQEAKVLHSRPLQPHSRLDSACSNRPQR